MFDLKEQTALVTGAAVVYLASEKASWITGQAIPVNGGSVTA
jgi:NAD(P)-dependent dehydrogenase (short-subunit alcohol dehydrogenase family)